MRLSILDRHLALAVLAATLATAMVLLALVGFVSFVEELDWARRHDRGADAAMLLTLYKLPELAFEMFPIMVLLGAILGLGSLAAAGELVVMQAAGMPVWRMAASVAVVGLLLGSAALLLGDRAVPWAKTAAADVKHGSAERDQSVPELWLREGVRFVHVGEVHSPTRLEQLRIFEMSTRGDRLLAVETVARADFVDGQWQGRQWQREDVGQGDLDRRQQQLRDLSLQFEPEVLQLFLLQADALSLPGLRRYIDYLERNKLDSHRPRLEFWRKLAAPLSVVAMMLLAVPFVLGPLRDTGAGQRLFVGVLIGIGFYVVNETAVSLGAVYRWSPVLAALAPALFLMVMAGWRLRSFRLG
jgi:lipopolysaccharide export system permease protein